MGSNVPAECRSESLEGERVFTSLKQIDELAIALGDRVDIFCSHIALLRRHATSGFQSRGVHCVRGISKCRAICVPPWLKPVVSNATRRGQRLSPTAETRRETRYRYLRRDSATAASSAYGRCLLLALCLLVQAPR